MSTKLIHMQCLFVLFAGVNILIGTGMEY